MVRRFGSGLWRRAKRVFGSFAVATALLAVQPAWAYVACVFTSSECSFEATCHLYDDTTDEDRGIIFHIEYYAC